MALTQLAAELAERAERLGPITIGLAGAGQMVAGDRNDVFNDAVLAFRDALAPA